MFFTNRRGLSISHFCEQDPMAKIQSVILIFQGESDENNQDLLLFRLIGHYLLFVKVVLGEITVGGGGWGLRGEKK